MKKQQQQLLHKENSSENQLKGPNDTSHLTLYLRGIKSIIFSQATTRPSFSPNCDAIFRAFCLIVCAWSLLSTRFNASPSSSPCMVGAFWRLPQMPTPRYSMRWAKS